MSNAIQQDIVRRKPDHIFVVLSLQELLDLRIRGGGVGAEVAADRSGPVTRDHGLKHILPTICRIDVTRTQRAAFQIT